MFYYPFHHCIHNFYLPFWLLLYNSLHLHKLLVARRLTITSLRYSCDASVLVGVLFFYVGRWFSMENHMVKWKQFLEFLRVFSIETRVISDWSLFAYLKPTERALYMERYCKACYAPLRYACNNLQMILHGQVLYIEYSVHTTYNNSEGCKHSIKHSISGIFIIIYINATFQLIPQLSSGIII